MKILEFILKSEFNLVGTLILIYVTCIGIAKIVKQFRK